MEVKAYLREFRVFLRELAELLEVVIKVRSSVVVAVSFSPVVSLDVSVEEFAIMISLYHDLLGRLV